MLQSILSYFFPPQLSKEEKEELAKIVEEEIKTNEVIVYSKSYCPYCKKAKQLLEKLGVKYKAVELNSEKNGAAIQDYLESRTGQRTVPNVFIKQQHVGGCDDLMAANANGSLQRILAA